MKCENEITLHGKPGYPLGLRVPCGQCLACRIAKRREWSARLQHELATHDDAVFVTLTYSDEYNDNSLHKRDLQLFFKRLRKALGDRRIRYFACGEYGDRTQRPHYHAIIFGLSLRDTDKQLIMDAWRYADWKVPAIRKESFGLAEPDSIRYVAQYIDKKYTGEKADVEYVKKNREPVFKIASQGIGRNYIKDNFERLRTDKSFTLNGVKYSLPRYYLKKLELDTEEVKEHARITECERVESIIGIADLTRDDVYMLLSTQEILKLEQTIKQQNKQHNKNIKSKIELKQRKL